jgi:hypothetical protein
MVLGQKQIQRSMEQNRIPRDHATVVVWYFTKEPKTCIGENTVSSTNGTGKAGYLHVED